MHVLYRNNVIVDWECIAHSWLIPHIIQELIALREQSEERPQEKDQATNDGGAKTTGSVSVSSHANCNSPAS